MKNPLNRAVKIFIILWGAAITAAVVVFFIFPVQTFFSPSRVEVDPQQNAEAQCVVTKSYVYESRGDSKDYVRTYYSYGAANQKYEKDFFEYSASPRFRERYAVGKYFRCCYDPRDPQSGYLPAEDKKCGQN